MMALATSVLLIFATFVLVTLAATKRGWGLIAGLSALGLGVGSFNLLIEAIAFDVLSWLEAAQTFAIQSAVVGVLAPLAIVAARPWAPALSASELRFDVPGLSASS